jgi:hypothetical protein
LLGFIARQRDLRELVDANTEAAKQLNIDDKLAHHEGRFATIELATTDLPEIASKRLLRARNDTAARKVDGEFERLVGGNEELRRIHLGDRHTKEHFRKVYPFSPVLVDTLVAASSMLQRDRTALKAMQQLLHEQRDSLEIGQLIPVGDLYDVICKGNDAVTGSMRETFERARNFYEQKLVPLMEQEHGIEREAVEALPWNDARRQKWRVDDRILKTLVLASLVQGVAALRALTPGTVALLNHGTIKTNIPGQEFRKVLTKLQGWGAKVPEIRIQGSPENPSISLLLHGIDLERVLDSGRSHDNLGNRVRAIRSLVAAELGIAADGGTSEVHFDHEWRGTRRHVNVVFANVANLALSALANDDEAWKFVIDYPIDEDGAGQDRDRAKIDEFRATRGSSHTILWLPAFLNHKGREDLGRFVVLEELLKSEQRFASATAHLSAEDRIQARTLMEGQRDTLRVGVVGYLRAAFGLSKEESGTRGLWEEPDAERTFVSLDQSLQLRPPAHGNLAQGLRSLVEQALVHQFPKAPNWDKPFTLAQVRRVLEIARRAASDQARRAPLDTDAQKLMRAIAVPLGLGEVGSAFVLSMNWHAELERKRRDARVERPTVLHLHEWMEEGGARGLPKSIKDLVAIVYADLDEREFRRLGAPIDGPDIDQLQDGDELVKLDLPSQEAWTKARSRAHEVFGVDGALYLNGANVASLAKNIEKTVGLHSVAAQQLHRLLEHFTPADLRETSHRLADARATLRLIEALEGAAPKVVVEKLAAFVFADPVTAAAVGASLKQAQSVANALERSNSQILFDGVEAKLDDPRAGAEARRILDEARRVICEHQYVTKLEDPLRRLTEEATVLVVARASSATAAPSGSATSVGAAVTPPAPAVAGEVEIDRGEAVVARATELDRLVEQLRRQLGEGTTKITISWRSTRRSKS